MKYRFVDVKNCNSLLPQITALYLPNILDKNLTKEANRIDGLMPGSVDALNELQVKNVFSGKNYSRIK